MEHKYVSWLCGKSRQRWLPRWTYKNIKPKSCTTRLYFFFLEKVCCLVRFWLWLLLTVSICSVDVLPNKLLSGCIYIPCTMIFMFLCKGIWSATRLTEMPEDVCSQLQTSCADSQVAWQLDRWSWYFSLANHKSHTQQGASCLQRWSFNQCSQVHKASAVQFCDWVWPFDCALHFTLHSLRLRILNWGQN